MNARAEYHKRWYEQNRAKHKEVAREWRARNKPHIRERAAARYATDRDAILAQQADYRRRKREQRQRIRDERRAAPYLEIAQGNLELAVLIAEQARDQRFGDRMQQSNSISLDMPFGRRELHELVADDTERDEQPEEEIVAHVVAESRERITPGWKDTHPILVECDCSPNEQWRIEVVHDITVNDALTDWPCRHCGRPTLTQAD